MYIMPLSLGTYEDMRLRPYTRISFNRTERYRGDPAILGSCQCRAALTTKTPSATCWRLVCLYKVFARDPYKITRIEFRISRKRGAMLTSTHGAVAVICIKERPGDFVTNLAA